MPLVRMDLSDTAPAARVRAISDDGYLGVRYSPDLEFIQVDWVAGRSVEVKQAFYRRIAEQTHENASLRREDVFVSLIDAAREDSSFGSGEMQHTPK